MNEHKFAGGFQNTARVSLQEISSYHITCNNYSVIKK